MKTADEFIDLLITQHQTPNPFFYIPKVDIKLAIEWVRFLACADMTGQVREDCLMEPLDYYDRHGEIKSFSAYVFIQLIRTF